MKKIIVLAIILLIFTFGVIFGKSWAQSSWVTSAVNKAIQAKALEDASSVPDLKNCKIEGGITSTESGKEVNINCISLNNKPVKVRATAVKDGKILFVNKYKFEGVTFP
ncbi:MAG: hypothetical protein QG623_376 [Patescibacteria group bacterium]|nr:hypothetical protein [Patescibacteria group bacterium]